VPRFGLAAQHLQILAERCLDARDDLLAVRGLAHRAGGGGQQLFDLFFGGDPPGLGDGCLERLHALLGDLAVGSEVPHQAQHRPLTRPPQGTAARVHVGDQQMDGVRADVENSQAHGTQVIGSASRGRGRVPPGPRGTDNIGAMSAEEAVSTAQLYREIARADWARLAAGIAQPITETEVVQIRGLGDRFDMTETRVVYLPLSRLLSLYAQATKRLGAATAEFLQEKDPTTPFVIGVAGSVAVGKSTIARLLRELLSRWADTPRVELITT